MPQYPEHLVCHVGNCDVVVVPPGLLLVVPPESRINSGCNIRRLCHYPAGVLAPSLHLPHVLGLSCLVNGWAQPDPRHEVRRARKSVDVNYVRRKERRTVVIEASHAHDYWYVLVLDCVLRYLLVCLLLFLIEELELPYQRGE